MFLTLLILIKLLVCIVRLLSSSFGYKKYSLLGLVSRKFPNVLDVKEISTYEEFDFLINRSFCYVRRMYYVAVTCFAKYWTSGTLI